MKLKAFFCFVSTMLFSTAIFSQVYIDQSVGIDEIGCGLPGSPCATIQYGIDNVASDGDIINIAAGTYSLDNSIPVWTPIIKIPENWSLSFIGEEGTILDGQDYRRAIMYDYTYSCTSASSNDGVPSVLNFTIKNILFQNCRTEYETCGSSRISMGGAIKLVNDPASELHVNFTNCQFLNNASINMYDNNNGAHYAEAGAIYIYGGNNTYASSGVGSSLVMDQCYFEGNVSNHLTNGARGGAMSIRDVAMGSISNTEFYNNSVYCEEADQGDLQADRQGGGAIVFYESNTGPNPNQYFIDQCVFSNNSATSADGATFSHQSEGGAIYLFRNLYHSLTNGTVTLSGNRFCNNTNELGIEHIDKNTGVIDSTSIGGNLFFDGPSTTNDIGDTSMCGGIMIIDAYIPGATYVWCDGSTDSCASFIKPDPYWVEITTECGTYVDSFTIFGVDMPVLNFPDEMHVCEDDEFNLIAGLNNGNNYLWNDGSTDTNLISNVPGLYSVEVTNICGTVTDSILVLTSAFADLEITGLTYVAEDEIATYSVNASPGSIYNWSYGGGSLISSTPNSITIQWETEGWEEVTVTETNTDGCIGEPTILSVAVGTVNIKDKVDQFKVYPNPSHARFTLDNLPEECQLQVTNLQGQKVNCKETKQGPKRTIDLYGLPKGTYILQLSIRDRLIYKKILLD